MIDATPFDAPTIQPGARGLAAIAVSAAPGGRKRVWAVQPESLHFCHGWVASIRDCRTGRLGREYSPRPGSLPASNSDPAPEINPRPASVPGSNRSPDQLDSAPAAPACASCRTLPGSQTSLPPHRGHRLGDRRSIIVAQVDLVIDSLGERRSCGQNRMQRIRNRNNGRLELRHHPAAGRAHRDNAPAHVRRGERAILNRQRRGSGREDAENLARIANRAVLGDSARNAGTSLRKSSARVLPVATNGVRPAPGWMMTEPLWAVAAVTACCGVSVATPAVDEPAI